MTAGFSSKAGVSDGPRDRFQAVVRRRGATRREVYAPAGGYAGGRSQREEVVPYAGQVHGRTALQQDRLRPLHQPQGNGSAVSPGGNF
jgi:hypothetical protein